MASATLTAKLVGDAKGMVDAFDKGEASAGKMGGTLGSVSKIASGFVLGAGLLQAPGILAGMAKSAADDAASITRLQTAVTNSGASWDALSGSMTTQISLAQKRAFTDDQARSSLALLVAQTGSAEEAQRRFSLAMDLSRGAGIDLETASRLLGKVTDENANVLNRYGIVIKEGAGETELFGAIQQKFGGQSEAFAKSAAGQGEAVAIAMAEAQESIGYLLLPALVALTSVLNSAVIPAIGFLTENADILMPALAGIGTAIAVVLVPATWAYVSALTAQAAAFIVANAPIIAIGVAIAAVVAIVIYAIKHWDDITAAVGRFWEYLKGVADNILDRMGPFIFLFGPLGVIVGVIRFRDTFIGAFQSIRDGVASALDWIGGKLQWIADRANDVIRLLSRIPGAGAVGSAIGGAMAKLPGFAEGGIVPGPIGAPMLAVVHGGEEVRTPAQRAGGGNTTTINLTVNSLDPAGAAEAVVRALTMLERQGRIANITVVG